MEYFTETAETHSKVLDKVRLKYGDQARILTHKSVRIPGFLGIFSREGVEVQALASVPVRLASAYEPLYAMRGPLCGRHSWRKVGCGAPAWLALARAASANKSMHTDAQVLSAASQPRLMGAGDFQR